MGNQPVDFKPERCYIIGMKNTGKATVAILTAVCLVLGSTVCCCLTRAAHAAQAKSACCHSKAVAHDQHAKACDTCTKRLQSADAAATFDLTPLAAYSVQPSLIVIAVLVPQVRATLNLSFLDSPPGLSASVPVYIKTHSLRV